MKDMEALKTVIKSEGWTLLLRKRGSNTEHIYAERMASQPRRKIERYIAPVSKLPELTTESVVEILNKKGARE